MLISFKVSNFKSILEPVTFNMLADKGDTFLKEKLIELFDEENKIDEEVERLAVLMGANGSGKSSLIDALKFVKNICLRQPTTCIPRNKIANTDMSSTFEVCYSRFSTRGSVIKKYTLEVFPNGIIKEKNFYLENEHWVEELSYLFKTYKNETNFGYNELNVDWKQEKLDKVYFSEHRPIQFFNKMIFLNSLENNNELYSYGHISSATRKKILALDIEERSLVFFDYEDDRVRFKKNLILLLNHLGINVIDLELKHFATDKCLNPCRIGMFVTPESFFSTDAEKEENPSNEKKERANDKMGISCVSGTEVTYHYLHSLIYKDYTIPISEESSGTRRLVRLAFSICMYFSGMASCLIIDEFDAGLHNTLASEFLKQILKIGEDDDLGTQVIVSSHNTVLLRDGLLRRDQIWFTDMKENRTTDLFSLAEIKGVKPSEDFAENYLRGKYGALPHIKEWMNNSEGDNE